MPAQKYASKYDEIAKLWVQSPRITVYEIADKVGIPRGSFAGVLNRLISKGVIEPRRGRGRYDLTSDQLSQIRAIHTMRVKEGKTLRQIAQQLGVSHQAVQQFLKYYGLPSSSRMDWVGELIKLYNNGVVSREELSEQLGVSYSAVSKTVVKLIQDGKIQKKPISKKMSPTTMIKVKAIDRMRRDGFTWKEIAAKLDVAQPTAHRMYLRNKHKLTS